jgi:hypothetical protein
LLLFSPHPECHTAIARRKRLEWRTWGFGAHQRGPLGVVWPPKKKHRRTPLNTSCVRFSGGFSSKNNTRRHTRKKRQHEAIVATLTVRIHVGVLLRRLVKSLVNVPNPRFGCANLRPHLAHVGVVISSFVRCSTPVWLAQGNVRPYSRCV